MREKKRKKGRSSEDNAVADKNSITQVLLSCVCAFVCVCTCMCVFSILDAVPSCYDEMGKVKQCNSRERHRLPLSSCGQATVRHRREPTITARSSIDLGQAAQAHPRTMVKTLPKRSSSRHLVLATLLLAHFITFGFINNCRGKLDRIYTIPLVLICTRV